MQGMHTGSSADQTKWLLALKMIKGIGGVTAIKLLQQFQSAQAIFETSSNQLKLAGLRASFIEQIKDFDFSSLDDTLEWAESPDRNIISIDSAHYLE